MLIAIPVTLQGMPVRQRIVTAAINQILKAQLTRIMLLPDFLLIANSAILLQPGSRLILIIMQLHSR